MTNQLFETPLARSRHVNPRPAVRLWYAERYADFAIRLLPSLTSAAAVLPLTFQTLPAVGAGLHCGAPSPPAVASYQHRDRNAR